MTQPTRTRKVHSPDTARKTQVLAPSCPIVAVDERRQQREPGPVEQARSG